MIGRIPVDVARWMFWVQGRRMMPVSRRATRQLGTWIGALQHRITSRRLLRDEVRRTFPDADPRVVSRDADQLWGRCMAEELVLDRIPADDVERWMAFRGRHHLDAAFDRGKGVILAFPHAGNVMLLIALLAHRGYPIVQVAARGFPPADRQVGHLRPTPLAREVRQAREEAEDQLPARFLTPDDPPRELYRTLARNELLAIAFDGRAGSRFRPTPWLGRTALLATGPWRLAASTGATVVPALCRMVDGEHVLELLSPRIPAESLPLQERCVALQHEVLADLTPLLEAQPHLYARWLLHCRRHAHADDHPLFTDVAPDDRWRRWEHARF